MQRPVDIGASLDVLCDAVVDRYHASLQEQLPRIRDQLAAMSIVASSPELAMVQVAFADVAGQIASHIVKEEQLLFPAIAALTDAEKAGIGRPPLVFATILHPIRLMEAEHGRIEMALDRLRELAKSVAMPVDTAQAWEACMADLTRLDAELRAHHRTENQVLFPRALELERRLV